MSDSFLEKVSLAWSKDSVRIINTPSAVAREMFFYIQECGSFRTRQSYFTERAGLDSFLLIFTLAGEGVIRFPDRKTDNEYHVHSGDCFLLDCMEHHYYTGADNDSIGENSNIKHGGWDFLWIHFNGNNSRGYFEQICPEGSAEVCVHDKTLLEKRMRQVINDTSMRLDYLEAEINALICSILCQMITDRISAQADGYTGGKRFFPEYVINAMKYMDKRFADEELDLVRISTNAGVSRFHLAREFRRCTGSTMHGYLIATRLSYAKELLKYSDRTVSDISQACGMENVSHFIEVFRKKETMTPLQYRKEWQSIY